MSRTDHVKVAVVWSKRGDEDIEYWRIRIGGSMARNSPSGRPAEGYSSSKSKGERRLFVISLVKSAPANASILARTSASGMVVAIRAIFYSTSAS